MSRDISTSLLELVRSPNYRPVKPKVIAKKLGLKDQAARDLKMVIKRLVKQGDLAYGENHLVMAAERASERGGAAGAGVITGVFRRAQAGFGFVRPSTTPPGAGRREDIFVPAKNSGDAASGDTVLLKVRKNSRRGKGLEGEIVEIVERERDQFVGTYFEQAGLALVEVDGGVFKQPVLVGDPGAKGACPGDTVVLEMARFPSHWHDGEGVIVKVLGPRGAPGVDTLAIVHEFNLPGEFPEEVLLDARRQARKFDESIGRGRHDLTSQTVITIDPEDARDFDDAISLERIKKGHWLLGVHIADVAHFVPLKSSLDQEARERATSVYLPDEVIPMLPEIISNNLASLQPDHVRYSLTAMLEFTPEGVPVGCELLKGAIRSRRRFTYEEVDDFLDDRGRWHRKLDKDVHRLLGEMHELAMILRRRRFEQGSLELTLPEVKIDLDRDGKVSGAHVEENTESHQVIEEFMLAANEAVARQLRDDDLVFIRRIHEAPDPEKLRALTEFVQELGFKTDSLESRFAIQGLLAAVREAPQQHAVNYAVLRSMQKAIYSPIEEGHYALASDCYCHFTSPIRRYPDLTIHRMIATRLTGKRPAQDQAHLAAQAEHCSQREQRAAQAERELKRVKLLYYMSERIGEEMDAIITGVEEYGLFVQGVALPAEGLVHVDGLKDDYYTYDKRSHTLTGRRAGNCFRLGDPVRVAAARVDIAKRKLDFRIMAHGHGAAPSRAKPQQRAGAKAGKKSSDHRGTSTKQAGKGSPGKKSPGKKSPGKKRRAKQQGGTTSRGKASAVTQTGAKKKPGKKTPDKKKTSKQSGGQAGGGKKKSRPGGQKAGGGGRPGAGKKKQSSSRQTGKKKQTGRRSGKRK